MHVITADFETRSACELKKAGAYVYSQHPTTEVICLAWSVDGGEPVLWHPEMMQPFVLFDLLAAGAQFVAHNLAFERAIWENVMTPRYGWPPFPVNCYDTMATCARKAIPLSLDEVGRVLRLDTQKDKEGTVALRKIMKPDRKGEWNNDIGLYGTVYDYCKRDVMTEVALHRRIGNISPSEMKVWQHNEIVNQRGLPLDMGLVANMQACVDGARPGYIAEFHDITGIDKPGSPKLLEWVNSECAAHFPDMKSETVAAALADWPLTDEVRRALILRKKLTSASVKKLAAMRACVGSDSRARGLLQYHGATTGRVAGRLLQPTNFPRGSIELGRDEDGNPVSKPEVLVPIIQSENWELLGMVAGCPIEAVASSLRNVIRAGDKRAIVASDYSTIEARLVLCLAGQWDKVQVLADGKDIYCDMATAIYKTPVNKKDHPEQRQTGKNAVLGLGFGMGAAKFQLRYAKKQPDEFCQEVVRVYREDFAPTIKALWRGLEDAATRAMWDRKIVEAYGVTYKHEGEWMTARLPSGRKLFYFGAEATRRAMPWDENDIRMSWSYKAKKMGKWVTIDTFGGHLAENVVQALSRDLTVDAAIRAEDNGFPVVLQVYDEIITEPPISQADHKVLADIMRDIPKWARDLRVPIASEGFTAERYRK